MMIIKKLFFLTILPFFALAPVSGQQEDFYLQKDKVLLTVAIEELGYFPFNYTENGEIKGFSVDVLNYFEAHSNYEFEFIILPWPRAVHSVSQGEVDLLLTFFRNEEREKIYHFIEPSYGFEVNQLFALEKNNFEFNGQLEQLKPFSIGTIREYSYGEAFDQANYLKKFPVLTEEILLKLLLRERIDIAISNPLYFKRMMSKLNVSSKVKALTPYVALTPVYMVLSKKRKDAIEIKSVLGNITDQLKASPYYQELLNKYQLNFQ